MRLPTLSGLLTGDSIEGRQFRAIAMWEGGLLMGREARLATLWTAADAVFGAADHDHRAGTYDDWQRDLELETGVARVRGEEAFDVSQPWEIPSDTLLPTVYVPLPESRSGPNGVLGVVDLAEVREVVSRYGITD